MRRKVESRLKLISVVLTISGHFALITTFNYPETILAVPLAAIALMPLGEWLDRRFTLYRRFTSGLTLAVVLAGAVSLKGSTPIGAVVELVMFIQVYVLLHRKRTREFVYLFLMAFFLVLAATVMTPRPEIALVFLVFLFSMTWGMTLLEMYATGSASAPEAEIAAPQWRSAAGQLLPPAKLRLFDARLSLLIATTVVGMLAIAVLMFVAGPRTEAGVLGASRPSDAPIVGLSSEVSLAGGETLQFNATPVMRVQFPRERDGQYAGPMFWRVTALDAYTGGSWQHKGLMTPGYNAGELKRLKSDARRASLEGIDREGGGWKEVYYEIYLDHPSESAAPLLQMVRQVTPGMENLGVQFRWDYANDFSVLVKARNDNGVYVQAWSEIIEPSPEQLRAAPSDYDRVMVRDDVAQLTYQDLLPETLALVRQLTVDDSTAIEKVQTLLHYLNGARFQYSRTIPDLPTVHAVDAFILRERTGHCQLFASALALMVRSLGIPARIVQGYRGGTWDPNDKSYTVTQDLAHIWTEVYFPTVGWVTFDPSPMDREPDFFSVSRMSRVYSRYLLKARMLWLRNVVSFQRRQMGMSIQAAIGRLFGVGGESWDALQQEERRRAVGNLAQGAALAVGFAATGALFLWLAIRSRGRGGARGGAALSADQRRAVRLRAEVVRKLRRLGLRGSGATAEELAELSARAGLDDGEAIPAALAIYNGARFGRRPFAAAELDAWRRRVGKLKRNAGRPGLRAG